MITQLIAYSAAYFIGSGIFLRIWCSTFGKYYKAGEVVVDFEDSGFCNRAVNNEKDGFFVESFFSSSKYISLNDAKFFAFAVWVPMTLLLGFHFGLYYSNKSARWLISHAYSLFIPKQMVLPPPKIEIDPYLEEATREVEQLMS